MSEEAMLATIHAEAANHYKPSNSEGGGSPTSSSANIDQEDAAERPMSFEDKRQLSQRLSQVSQPELLNSILAAVMQDPNEAAEASDQELEVDLDQLQPGTLWKLKGLLDDKEGPAAKSNVRGAHENNLQQPHSELHPGKSHAAAAGGGPSNQAHPTFMRTISVRNTLLIKYDMRIGSVRLKVALNKALRIMGIELTDPVRDSIVHVNKKKKVDDPPKNTMMTIEMGHNRITFREEDDEDELKEVFSFLDAKTELLLASAKAATNEEEEGSSRLLK